MDKNLTELVFILDRSGSMGGLESDTIGGFNSLLEKQKKVEGKCNLTTVLFDHDYELLHDRINIQAVCYIPCIRQEFRSSTKKAAVEHICKCTRLRLFLFLVGSRLIYSSKSL